MPKRDDDLLVADMIEAGEKIITYVSGLDYQTFIIDSKTVDAVIRNFEVLGEACKYISTELKSANPYIEWRKISDFRNILIHEYFGIDHQILWEIIDHELPDQIDFLNQLYKTMQ